MKGSGCDGDDATVTTIASSDSDRNREMDSSGSRVIADITVKFITMCSIRLPMPLSAGEGEEEAGEGLTSKKWRMMRVFNWTFSGQLDGDMHRGAASGGRSRADTPEGREGLEWRISQVATTSWD